MEASPAGRYDFGQYSTCLYLVTFRSNNIEFHDYESHIRFQGVIALFHLYSDNMSNQ